MNDYSSFSCPNQNCTLFRQTDQGNIKHRSWTGKERQIERLRCTECRKEFSSRKGTLQENAKISPKQQVLLLKCIRWGVCDEGSADFAEVNIKTVQRFFDKAARRAEGHHNNNNVQNIDESYVQLDELHAKMAGKVRWLGAAIGMQSLMILAVYVGGRSQYLADSLLAAVWARCSKVTLVLTDGWACYYSAILRAFGRIYQPRRTKGKGCKKKRIKFKKNFFYGQVVKGASLVKKRWKLHSVVLKAISGGIENCIRYIKAYGLGTTIHTAHIERWFGSLRNSLSCLKRKSRCPVKNTQSLKEKVWIFVSLYNWVLPHDSLKLNGQLRTPAMAAGLAAKPITYLEYIHLSIHLDHNQQLKIENKLEEMRSDEFLSAAKRTERPPPEERVVWKKDRPKEEAA